jgi:ERCC4-type nuclease
MQGLLSASEAEIGQVKGIGQVLARQIYKILHE